MFDDTLKKEEEPLLAVAVILGPVGCWPGWSFSVVESDCRDFSSFRFRPNESFEGFFVMARRTVP